MKIQTYQDLMTQMKTNPYGTAETKGPGFHGDLKLIYTVDSCLNKADAFIETGTNMGNTLYFVSRNYNLFCYSCETHARTPSEVVEVGSIHFEQKASPGFLYDLCDETNLTYDEVCVFWLDAHYSWAEEIIYQELEFIVNNFKNYYIFCDDVDINNPAFSNDMISLERLYNITNKQGSVYIPNYSDQTSEYHINTGWCLITNQDINDTKYIKLYNPNSEK